ncbi:hypothetical protein DL764_008436 [Monosporascus ibericus]|uniref:Uncharacterized protein n=1 Tax=Monosporascus ibericus TaxID=155417 RepID=A0A4Q4T0X1_9PEZI|nr:hypothetical protein DL764_008436 [Monosporascus ibericus]
MLKLAAIPGIWASLSSHVAKAKIEGESDPHQYFIFCFLHCDAIKLLRKASDAWVGCRNGIYDLVAVDSLRAAEVNVQAMYREHGEAGRRGPAGGARIHEDPPRVFLRNYHAWFMKAPFFFRGNYIESECLLEAHRVLGPELHRPFERLRFYARLIRGNIHADLNIRQPYPYHQETLETVRDTIDEWIIGDSLRPPVALATVGAPRPRPIPLQRGAVPPVLGATLRRAAAGVAGSEAVGGHGRTDRAPGRRRLLRRRRAAPPRAARRCCSSATGTRRGPSARPREARPRRSGSRRENEREPKELASFFLTRRERFRSARIQLRADNAAKIVEHSAKNMRGISESPGLEKGSDPQQQQQQQQPQRRFAPAELL